MINSLLGVTPVLGSQIFFPSQTKNQLVSLYTEAAKANEKVKEVVGLHYLEETPNKNDGSRFLLEMDVKLKESPEEVVRTSEYVYLKEGSTQLCHTSNFQWRKNTKVYFVVSGM